MDEVARGKGTNGEKGKRKSKESMHDGWQRGGEMRMKRRSKRRGKIK